MRVRLEPLAEADPLARPALAAELVQRWLVWDAFTCGKRRVDVHPLVLDAEAHAEAIRVATRAAELVMAAADRAADDPDERARYGLHADVERLAAASRAAGDLASLVRVDLLLREGGAAFVACEVNADCPGGHNETLALPRLARLAGLRGLVDPTDVALRLADRLVALSGGPGSPRGIVGLVLATGYAEDLQVCALVERLVRERGGRVKRMTATAPREEGGRLVAGEEPLSVLYRFFPAEYMEGQRNVEAIARAIERGELRTLASFAAIHAQSKLAMARAWVHDRAAAAVTFPESVAVRDVHPERLLAERASWVVKRDLSRVGDHVLVGALMTDEEWTAALAEVAEAESLGDVWIAQRFAPQAPIATPWGERLVTLGVYLEGGAFAGYFARLSETSLCSHDALAVPVFVDARAAEVAA